MFNGSTGKLIMLEDGSFAVEKTNTKDTDLLEKLLESLETDLAEETDPELRALIQRSIINTRLDIKDSKQDYWLNTVVDKHNSIGHKGLFFDRSDEELFRKAGFDVRSEVASYFWYFNNKIELEDFVTNLFGILWIS